jgi:ATP-dependent Clp protease adaptor protein ClpS
MNYSDTNILLSTQELEELDTITTDDVTTAAKVILFNDEVHSFDEVIEQIIKAIKCSVKRAEKLTWEVHNKGKACVYSGDLPECLRVSSVLEEIALHTQVEY